MKRFAIFLVAIILLAEPAAMAAQETLPPWRRDLPDGRNYATITVGSTEVEVDLAIDAFEQQLGLGYRNGLDDDTGMLFLGSAPVSKTFWMKGMRFCIDIIWIHDGEIKGAAEFVCPDPDGTDNADRARYSSGEPVTHVLEMPAGWMQSHGYGRGTPVDLGDLEP